MKSLKKIATIVVLTAILVSQFLPVTSHAQVRARRSNLPELETIVVDVLFCTFSPILGDLIEDVLGEIVGGVGGVLDSIVGGFFGGLLGSDAVPTEVVRDNPASAKETRNCITSQVKRAFIAAVVSDVMNFVRGDGKPRYIQNFREALATRADQEAALFLTDLTGVNICRPFRLQLDILLEGTAFPRQRRLSRLSCTLSRAIDIQSGALDDFYQDFRTGNWDAWITLHETQNNLLGAYLIANDEILFARGEAVEAEKLEAEVSQGYLSTTLCKEAIFTFADGSTQREELSSHAQVGSDLWQSLITQKGAEGAECVATVIVTPGALIADQVSAATQIETENLINSNEWYEIVREIVSALTSDILRNGL